jgi:hypothetical protein
MTTNHLLPAAALGGGKDSKSALHLTQQRLMACFRFCHDQMQAFKYVSARRIPPLSAWHSEVFYGSQCDAQPRSQLPYNHATQVKNEASCVPQCHVSLHIRRANADRGFNLVVCHRLSRMWPLAPPRLFPACRQWKLLPTIYQDNCTNEMPCQSSFSPQRLLRSLYRANRAP